MNARFCRVTAIVLMSLMGLCLAADAGLCADAPKGHGAADSHAGDAHPTGVPLDPKKDLVVWSIVTFVLFAILLRSAAWGPLSQGLNAREAGIHKAISDAENARLKSEQMLAEHERKLSKVQDEVKNILDEARRDAETARQNIMNDATRDAEATRNRALADIERAKNQALDELFNVMSSRVLAASEHVIGRSLKDEDHSRLVDEALSGMAQKA